LSLPSGFLVYALAGLYQNMQSEWPTDMRHTSTCSVNSFLKEVEYLFTSILTALKRTYEVSFGYRRCVDDEAELWVFADLMIVLCFLVW